MLILSRRPAETINFPQLGVSVSIVSVKGSRVQVGIDAPPEIRIVRHELATAATSEEPQPSAARKAGHDFNNRLNQATLGLHLAQQQLAAGRSAAAAQTLTTALARLAALEQAVSRSPAGQNLPANGSQPSVASTAAAPAPLRRSGEGAKPVDVLLVEDDQNEQALLRGILEMEGYRVQTANNGHEALACLRRCTPRFVLLDMMMPECDGGETLQRIREAPAWRRLPVFAVSGSAPESLGLPIGGGGVDDWFPKPLNAPQLVQAIRDRVADLCV